ncbi:MAG TPA: hypothetical protein VNQ90_19235 [Chthoniobacteraceae bacterium]|nr:hypothetical protein [Chthoniobacteraceae bacterium]
MIEEPYRWMEAIQNRREYIDLQLATGSAIVALSCPDGVLLLTVGSDRQKLFEIYDRIAMGGIGHPGDLERLRMKAIEVTSVEGFTRSSLDVSLRRLVHYSLSSMLKEAFEQVYGAPFLVRLLFAELGRDDAPDLLVRLDYDGSFKANGGVLSGKVEPFAVVAGQPRSAAAMEEYLRGRDCSSATLEEAKAIALDAWMIGSLVAAENRGAEEAAPLPDEAAIARHREKVLGGKAAVEVALLDRRAKTATTWRPLSFEETESPARPADEEAEA